MSADLLRRAAVKLREHAEALTPEAITTVAGWLDCVAIDEEYGEPWSAPRARELSMAELVARAVLREPEETK